MINLPSVMELLAGNSLASSLPAVEIPPDTTRARVLAGFHDFAEKMSHSNHPIAPQLFMIAGVVNGMLDTYIAQMDDDTLDGTLTYLINEFSQWRREPTANAEQPAIEQTE